jgi:O-antigen/teichoic acid export membrane protein
MASDLHGIPLQALIVPLGQPLLAVCTLHHDKPQRDLAATYLKATNGLLGIGGPVLLALSILAVPAVRLVLGPAWADTGHWLQWLALIAIFGLPGSHVGALALARGQARMMAWRAIGEFAVALPALLVASKFFGVPGVIVARAAIMVVVLTISMATVRRLAGASYATQLFALHRTALALGVMAITMLVLRIFVVDSSLPIMAFGLATVSAAGVIAYLAALYLVWSAEGHPAGIERVAYEKADRARCFFWTSAGRRGRESTRPAVP